MRVDWRKPCISDHSFTVVSTKIFKVPGFRRACSQHNLTSSTPELPTQFVIPCTTCEVIGSSVQRKFWQQTCAGGRDLAFCTNFGRCNSASGPEGSVILHLETKALFIRAKIRRVLNKTQTISYKRHIKTRLSQDASYRRTGVTGCSWISRVLAKFQMKCVVYTG